jgi:RNA polymerase sigma-70 factor (ECF subfamily)
MSACLAMPLPMMETPRSESAAGPAAADADANLVRRAAAGDTGAFEALYRRHAGRVHGAVWRLAAFSTWLHRLAVNVALMDLRARDPEDTVENDVLEAASDPVMPFCAGERADLEQAVAKLPPRARAVLVLHDVEGWKHEEIGRELGMAIGSSKAQLHRARGLLRRMLGETP